MIRRKRRKGEVICKCGSYPFPHRQMGGQCDGSMFVSAYFAERMHRECKDCHLREIVKDDGNYEIVCQAGEGREPSTMCPGLQEHIQFNGIKLYGANKL